MWKRFDVHTNISWYLFKRNVYYPIRSSLFSSIFGAIRIYANLLTNLPIANFGIDNKLIVEIFTLKNWNILLTHLSSVCKKLPPTTDRKGERERNIELHHVRIIWLTGQLLVLLSNPFHNRTHNVLVHSISYDSILGPWTNIHTHAIDEAWGIIQS